MKVGVDQFFELAVGASKSSEQGEIEEWSGVKQHTLESIFSRLFNRQEFQTQIRYVGPHDYLVHGGLDRTSIIVGVSGQIVRCTDEPGTESLVDLLVGPRYIHPTTAPLYSQAVICARTELLDSQLNDQIRHGSFNVLGKLSSEGPSIRLNRRGDTAGLVDRLAVAGITNPDKPLTDQTEVETSLELFPLAIYL